MLRRLGRLRHCCARWPWSSSAAPASAAAPEWGVGLAARWAGRVAAASRAVAGCSGRPGARRAHPGRACRTRGRKPRSRDGARLFRSPARSPRRAGADPAVRCDLARPAGQRGRPRRTWSALCCRTVARRCFAMACCSSTARPWRRWQATRVCSAGFTNATPECLRPSHRSCRSAMAALVLPGGDDNAATWAAMVGEPLTDPASRDCRARRRRRRPDCCISRTRWPVSTRRTWPWSSAARPPTRRRSIRRAACIAPSRASSRAGSSATSRSCAWAPTRRCCCPVLRTDPTTGRLRHTKAFWEVALGDRRLPEDVADALGGSRQRRPRRAGLAAAATDRRAPAGARRATAHLRVRRTPDRSAARRIGGRPGVAGPRISSLSRVDADARTPRHQRRRGAQADGHSRRTRHVRSPTTPPRSRSAWRCFRRR